MAKKRITITIDPDIEEWLLPEAKSTGKSLSQIIRLCLKEYRELSPKRFSNKNSKGNRSEDTWIVPEEHNKHRDF